MKNKTKLLLIMVLMAININGCVPYQTTGGTNNSGAYSNYGSDIPKVDVSEIYIAEGKWYLGKIGVSESDFKINNIYDSEGNGGYIIDFTMTSTSKRQLLRINYKAPESADYTLSNVKLKETFTGNYIEDLEELSDTTYFKVTPYRIEDISNFTRVPSMDGRKITNNITIKSADEVYLYPYEKAKETESTSSTENTDKNNQ